MPQGASCFPDYKLLTIFKGRGAEFSLVKKASSQGSLFGFAKKIIVYFQPGLCLAQQKTRIVDKVRLVYNQYKFSFFWFLLSHWLCNAWWNQFDNATWHAWLLGVTLKISDQLQWDNDSGALAYHWDAWNCNDNGKRMGHRRSLPLPSGIVFSLVV